jgi:hypothetical protein
MALFGRKRKSAEPARFEPPVGTAPCSERGCPNHTGVQCNYVDRRRRPCTAAFCPEHWAVIGGIVYCRRHAGTIAAIGAGSQAEALPDVDNRAASLVNWVARDLTPFIDSALQAHAGPHEHLVPDPRVKVGYDRLRARRFERSWKLVDHTGVALQVSLFVSEDDDATVHIRVGAGVVAEGVPPWIERRRRRLVVSEEVDQAQRQMFYRFLQEHISSALEHTRSLDHRYR